MGSKAVFSGARVFNSAAQTLSNNTVTVLTFDSERFDTSNYHSVLANTSRLTVPQSGYYHIGANVGFVGSASGNQRQLRLLVNGTTIICLTNDNANVNGNYLVAEVDYALNAQDYVEVQGFQDAGGNLDTVAAGNYSPEFWIHRLGDK